MTTPLPNRSPFNLSVINTSCERLGRLELRRIAREAGLSNEEDEATPGQAMLFWFADLLTTMPIDQEQRFLVFDEYKDAVRAFGDELGQAVDARHTAAATGNKEFLEKHTKLPVRFVGIGDRRYVAFTGNDRLLDITTGDTLPGKDKQFLETIQYNLTTLFMNRYLSCKYLIGDTDGPENRQAANVR